jgi:hypothetical protein
VSTLDPAVYRRAADVIRQGGLAKRAYRSGSTHCTVGALRTARQLDALVGSPLADEPWTVPLAEMLGLPIGDAPCHAGALITVWNDEEERTEQDVILLLEQAAEKLEADR